jgi:hypothetical protein
MEHVTRQRHQFIEPERLESDVGAKGMDLVGLRFGEIVIPRDDCHRRVLHTWDRTQGPQHLNATRQRHSQIKDDGMRTMGLSQAEASVCRVGGPHFEALETQHPRKQFCNANVVVHDQDAYVGGARRHWLIVVLESRRVKCPGRSRDLTVWAAVAFVLYSGASVGMSRPLGLPVPARSGGEGRCVYRRRRFC